MKIAFYAWLSRSLFLPMVLLSGLAVAQPANGELGDALNALIAKGAINRWLKNEPITTSIRDTDKRVDLNDSFGNEQVFRPMHRQPRSAAGGYLLPPGFYELRSRSYCIRAGTHAPSNGDGYLYAPLLGRQKDIVASILTSSAQHPEIDQHDVQLLLWGIIARSDFNSMNSHLVGVATTLMKPAHLIRLNKQAILGAALTLIDSPQLTAGLRSVFSAEHQIRQTLSQAQSSFLDVEQLAMLAGPALVDNPDVRRGRWSKHPDGYYVRYFPAGYSRTVIQVYVPEGMPAVDFDAADDVAVPANTGAQRLALSNVPFDTTGYAPEAPAPVVVARLPPPPPPVPVPAAPPAPRPVPKPVMQQLCGQVLDANTGDAIAGARIVVGDLRLETDADGRFMIANLTAGRYLGFVVKAATYETDSLELEIQRLPNCQPVVINLTPVTAPPPADAIVLGETPLRQGDHIILENIQFEQSRSELLADGKAELERVAVWMQVHSTVTVELSGYTSDEGARNANIDLSRMRAATCKRYLTQKGITASRIQTVGYGPDHPIVPNTTPEKVKNRRVELKIVTL